MTAISRKNRRSLAAAAAMLSALFAGAPAAAANAAVPASSEPSTLQQLFAFRGLGAWEYILLFVALIVAAIVGFAYYRSALLDSLKKMQPPSRVKVRAVGLAIVTFAMLLMLSPALPAGILMIIIIVGLMLAIASGLSATITIILVCVTAILATLWFTGLLHF